MKTTLAVIGSSSMVGSRFCQLSRQNFEIIEADLHSQWPVDITDQKSVNNFFSSNNFQALILFSAFTDVDEAEKQRGDKSALCWKINVAGVKNVAESARKFKRQLISISTDFVFDGTSGPYNEKDPPAKNISKISWYGITKMEGEKQTERMLLDFIIIRIAYPYRGRFQNKDDFAKAILRKYRQKSLFPMFSDQFFTPTFIDDLAPATKLILDQNESGIFHIASPGITTPYDFAKSLIDKFGGDSQTVKKGSILTTKLPAPRPINGGLKTGRIKKLGFTPTDWEQGIKTIYEQSSGKLL